MAVASLKSPGGKGAAPGVGSLTIDCFGIFTLFSGSACRGVSAILRLAGRLLVRLSAGGGAMIPEAINSSSTLSKGLESKGKSEEIEGGGRSSDLGWEAMVAAEKSRGRTSRRRGSSGISLFLSEVCGCILLTSAIGRAGMPPGRGRRRFGPPSGGRDGFEGIELSELLLRNGFSLRKSVGPDAAVVDATGAD